MYDVVSRIKNVKWNEKIAKKIMYLCYANLRENSKDNFTEEIVRGKAYKLSNILTNFYL